MSIMMLFQLNYIWPAIFILLACVADRYDGVVVRHLNISSELGKELDSLADLVSFGVAPSILAFNLYGFSEYGIWGYLLVLLFPMAGAYRLARFNVTEFDGELYGLILPSYDKLLSTFRIYSNINNCVILSYGL